MTHRTFITAGDGLPAWSSPISHAVVVGSTCYVSGQLSVDAHGSYVEGTFREEAERAFGHVFRVLRAAGFARDDLVFVDVAFADLQNRGIVDELFAEYFAPARRPARTVYQAAALPFGGKVKVMGTAVADARVSTSPPDGLPRYRLLTGPDDQTFCERVSAALDMGYQLHGAPSITRGPVGIVAAQAVVWAESGRTVPRP